MTAIDSAFTEGQKVYIRPCVHKTHSEEHIVLDPSPHPGYVYVQPVNENSGSAHWIEAERVYAQ